MIESVASYTGKPQQITHGLSLAIEPLFVSRTHNITLARIQLLVVHVAYTHARQASIDSADMRQTRMI